MARNDKFAGVKTLSELQAQRDDAFAAFEAKRDAAIKAGPTDTAAIAAATEAADAVDEFDAELAERNTETKAAEDAFAALQARKFATAEEEVEEPAEGAEAEAEKVEAEETVDQPEAEKVEAEKVETEVEEPAAPVAASGKTVQAKAGGSRVKQLAGKTARPSGPSTEEVVEKTALSMVAAAGSGFESGQVISFEEVSQGILEKIGGFSVPDESMFDHGDSARPSVTEFPVAKIKVDFPAELTIDAQMGQDQIDEILAHAADESRLEGNSLVAAGGWCAPSEVLYDLSEDESLDGILSLPEVAVKRGGFRHTPGPQFADFYASPGFKQTEAQAIAGTTKTAVEVSCPTFTDERLDVLGLWIKVPILTEVGYPELVRRFASGSMTAHEHWKNADIIARVVALSTTRNMTGTGLGGSVDDALEALDLVAQQRRQSQRLKFDRTMEVLLPFWVQSIYLNDLARRNGRTEPASEGELNAWFTSRKLSVQWLYDWQVLPATATDVAFPATYSAVIYPAGTFVKGTSAVIKLGAIYDSGLLATNEYTGSFTEEGLLVAKMKLGSDILTNMPTCSAGRRGALDLTCA